MRERLKSLSSLIYPWIAVMVFVQGLLFQIEPVPRNYELRAEEGSITEKEYIEALESGNLEAELPFRIQSGVWKRLQILLTSQELLESSELPNEAKLEATLETLDRAVFSHKLLVILSVFFVLLSMGAWIGIQKKVWFSISISKAVHWISLFFLLQYFGVSLQLLLAKPVYGIPLFLISSLAIACFGFSYSRLRELKREWQKNPENFAYVRLQNLNGGEEGDSETHSPSYPKLKILFHFFVIILIGIAMGNFVYIPLFLLQKHYFREFGILLGFLIVLLSAFYIRNYNKIASENQLTLTQKIVLGFSYLQFRFLRNAILFVGVSLGVGIFVSVLFSLLAWNTELLQTYSNGWIEKSTEF